MYIYLFKSWHFVWKIQMRPSFVNVNVMDTILWQGHHDRVMQLNWLCSQEKLLSQFQVNRQENQILDWAWPVFTFIFLAVSIAIWKYCRIRGSLPSDEGTSLASIWVHNRLVHLMRGEATDLFTLAWLNMRICWLIYDISERLEYFYLHYLHFIIYHPYNLGI